MDNRHRVVEKDELIAAAWRDVAVTDDSLIHAISVIRRALGDDAAHASFIETIPRRGYRFMAAVEPDRRAVPASPERITEARPLEVPVVRPAMPHVPAIRHGGGSRRVAGNRSHARLTEGLIDDSAGAAVVRIEQGAPPGTAIVSGGVVSLTGRHLAFAAQDESGQTSLWVRALDSAEPRRLPGTEGASKPFFSPDGESLAFFSRGRLLATDLAGRAVRTIAAADVTVSRRQLGLRRTGALRRLADRHLFSPRERRANHATDATESRGARGCPRLAPLPARRQAFPLPGHQPRQHAGGGLRR